MAFTAKYPGTCLACDERIAPGDQVEYGADNRVVHVICPDIISDKPTKGFCKSCFIALPEAATGDVCDECV